MSHKFDIGGCRAEPGTLINEIEFKLKQCSNKIHHMCTTEQQETINTADRSNTWRGKTRYFCSIKWANFFFNSTFENKTVQNNTAGVDKPTENASGTVSTTANQKSITSCGILQRTIQRHFNIPSPFIGGCVCSVTIASQMLNTTTWGIVRTSSTFWSVPCRQNRKRG